MESFQGVDEAYDQALQDFFCPYHGFVDLIMRVAVNQQSISEEVGLNLTNYSNTKPFQVLLSPFCLYITVTRTVVTNIDTVFVL